MTYCDTCGHQFSDVCGTCETLEGVPVKYKKKTNADRIRNMNDEELARWIHQTRHNPLEDRNYREWLEWLKQEVSNDS